MNKWAFFFGGLVAGVVLTAIILAHTGNGDEEMTDVSELKVDGDYKEFDKPGDVIDMDAVKVFQVLDDHAALVSDIEDYMHLDVAYLLVNKGKEYYYDNQVVAAGEGEVFRQIGIYRYVAKNESVRTVPVITLMVEEKQ